MINILSITCGMAFAPYLEESAREYLGRGRARSRVVRQGGSGLIIRSDAGLKLRFQNRESELESDDARHYKATLGFRIEFYDLSRMSDEVVLGSVGKHLLVSHPQSEMWLEYGAVSSLLAFARGGSGAAAEGMLPDWLALSEGGGRLLLSDQRNGRWVLFGSDHMAEIERRSHSLFEPGTNEERLSPPTISMRGVTLRLQSALHLAGVLDRFAEGGEVTPYEETFADARLRVARSIEGIEVSDGRLSARLSAKDARKWAGIIRGELDRLNAFQNERGHIRTVLADGEGGRWVLQWGDEVFLKKDRQEDRVVTKRAEGFTLLLDRATGNCAALDQAESARLFEATQQQ